jgi:hypothetical protein
LTKTQLSVLASYSMPFVLIFALVINGLLQTHAVADTSSRLIFLSAAFPIGFVVGRLIYLRRSHVEITFDNTTFKVIKGSKEVSNGFWRSYRYVSLILDKYGRPNLRLYEAIDGDHLDLPISSVGVDPQGFRDRVQELILPQARARVSPQVAEAA